MIEEYAIADIIVNKYLENNNIDEMIEKFNEITCHLDKIQDYEENIGNVGGRIAVLSILMCFKPLKDNREHLNKLIDILEEEVANLRYISKEVK